MPTPPAWPQLWDFTLDPHTLAVHLGTAEHTLGSLPGASLALGERGSTRPCALTSALCTCAMYRQSPGGRVSEVCVSRMK